MWNYDCRRLRFRSPGQEDVNTAEPSQNPCVARVGQDDGYIENKKSGKKLTVIKDRGTYAIEVEYIISNTSAKDKELGFTQH